MNKPVIQCSGVWKIFGDRSPEAFRAIRDEGLSKSDILRKFGCATAVADVSFSVDEGKIYCIMGLTGSGKSTLVRHLNRLVEPTAGEIIVAARNINALNARDLRALRSQSVGMVFQNMALLPHRSVEDNVALSLELRGTKRSERTAKAREKLKLVGLEEWAHRYPRRAFRGHEAARGIGAGNGSRP
ncbi:hypothetical protein X729_32010 [Mesorhizobium sp. L103C131B0]|nr:ATP-binding cassette domain-containing protein [Mesorhizobium sp. L103C131B0]ESZ53454.1 hypothetical protein X729_32010 [Mesorhizobium sp. L103C131B0]